MTAAASARWPGYAAVRRNLRQAATWRKRQRPKMISVIYTDENERELAEFITRSLEGLDIERFEWMALAADIGRGEVLTGYYKSGVQDKLLAALHIMSDGLYGIVDANFDRLMRDHGYDAPDESGEDKDVF